MNYILHNLYNFNILMLKFSFCYCVLTTQIISQSQTETPVEFLVTQYTSEAACSRQWQI